MLERDFQINQDEIAEYFEEETTLKGIFDLYEELFNISIVYDPEGVPPEGGPAWAEDVQFVYIYEKGGEQPLGGVYETLKVLNDHNGELDCGETGDRMTTLKVLQLATHQTDESPLFVLMIGEFE